MAFDLGHQSDNDRLIHELKNKINKFEIILQAYFELMQDKGITEDMLNAKIDEILAREVKGEYGGRRKSCPKCGKPVQESYSTPLRGRCVMCGIEVMFYPFEKKEEPEAPVERDPLDDLGF